MENPLVSIITITLNRADLIHRCIESIQKQTYSNFEHIIVDGNSTDNTEEVVKSYKDPRIKYIKLKERGPQLQMRAGADVATGKYVTFLDDDDEYLPTKIEKQVTFFESLPESIGLTYCWMTIYDTQTGKVLRIHKPEFRGDCGDITAAYQCISGTPTLMIRREIFEAVGGTFDDSIGLIMSDQELVARICQITKVDYLPESLIKIYENHNHARLTTNFYSEKLKRDILFRKHFLTKFHDVFERQPSLADEHYFNLCRDYFKLHQYRNGLKNYCLLLKCKPSIKQIIKPIIGVMLNR